MKQESEVIIYFPNTGDANYTPPYEAMFQKKALESIGLQSIIIDGRFESLDKHITPNNKNITLIISTIIKYTSITIINQYNDGLKIAKEYFEKYSLKSIWTGQAALLLKDQLLDLESTESVIDNIDEKVLLNFLSEKFSINTNSLEYDCNFDIDCIDLKPYIHNKTLDYISSTGCINSCTFCSVPSIYKQKWKQIDKNTILKHFQYLKSNYPEIEFIHFRDDNFAVNKKKIFSLLNLLKSEKLNYKWSAQTSVNILKTYSNDELLRLNQYGCNNISIGIESGDPWLLEKITKNKTTVQDSLDSIQRLLKSGIEPSVTSIVGFPFNNKRDIKLTLKLLMKIKLIYPSLSLYSTFFLPIPTTQAFEEIYGKGNNDIGFGTSNKWLTRQDKELLHKFESTYFLFCDKNFHKRFNPSKRLKLTNKTLYPFIRLRFRSSSTSFLWEHKIASILLGKSFETDSKNMEYGIRKHNTNYDFGLSKSDNNSLVKKH
ncbi:MAG: B12-binding domain-containing radical SAM protein [Bacteroidales bacterium]|jgi:radical SAM superfamily enzyme YgiQ (UPF0313 family)|nr:radical SAM protein [Bacteroidales bacterium]